MAEIVYPPVIVALKTFWRYLGLQFHFEGEAHIPRKGGAILAMNHIGYLDFALIGTAALPAGRLVRFMAKKEIFDNKLAGPLMRGMHHINVDRSSGTASFVAALRALRSGEVVGIFPEGTISRSFEIKELKSGAVRLAMGSGVPVIPTIVWGSQRIWTKGVSATYVARKFQYLSLLAHQCSSKKVQMLMLERKPYAKHFLIYCIKYKRNTPIATLASAGRRFVLVVQHLLP